MSDETRLLLAGLAVGWLAVTAGLALRMVASASSRARAQMEWAEHVDQAMALARPGKTLAEAEAFERIASILAANEAMRANWDAIWDEMAKRRGDGGGQQ